MSMIPLALVVAVILVGNIRESARDGAVQQPVKNYLNALADGDAQRALGYLEWDQDPGSEKISLLTDKVLDEAESPYPNLVTDVSLSTPLHLDDGYSLYAEYTLEGVPVRQKFVLSERQGKWKIVAETAVVRVSLDHGTSALEVNSVPVPDGLTDFYLFPGSYRVTTSSVYYEFDSFALELYDYHAVSTVVNVALPELLITQKGREIFRAAVSKALSDCLDEHGIEAGCGLDLATTLDDGTVVDDGSITRTASPAVWAELEECSPRLVRGPNQIELRGSLGAIQTTGSGTRNGTPTTFDLDIPLDGTIVVDMASPEPEVRW